MENRQFSVGAILWLTTVFALLLAYSKWVGGNATQHLVVYLMISVVIGLCVGLLARKLHDVLYWSILTNVLVYLAVAGGRLPSGAVMLAWSSVGASCGAIGAIPWPRNNIVAIVASTLLAAACICAGLLLLGEQIVGLIWFDVVCAAVVGGLLRGSIPYLHLLLKRSKQPRLVMAAWLCLCILLGNFLVPIVAGVQR